MKYARKVKTFPSHMIFLVCILLIPVSTLAQESASTTETKTSEEKSKQEREYAEQDWGLAMGLRYAEIPYVTLNGDRTVADVVPLMFFDNKYVFIRGLEGGVKIINKEQYKLNAILRYHFFDIPAEYQNQVSGTWDGGVQFRFKTGEWDLRTELMTDGDGNPYVDLGFDASMGDKYASYYPYIGLRFVSSGYNTKYYGFNREYIDSGVEFHAYIEGRYHLISNLYMIGRLGGTVLGSAARNSIYVQEGSTWEAYAGIAFFNNPDKPRNNTLTNNAYLRLAYGDATPSNLGDILQGDKEPDPYNNKLASLFYGYPLTDELFGLPLDIYLTPGLVHHLPSEVQESFLEYVLAIKAYYTFKMPVRVRFGLAEGLSYSSQINYIEETELAGKGYRPSKLLNYLDFSVDVNIGDIFSSNSLRNTWFGYSIHHRSGIFETGSQFGRIKGGSNYTTLYIQQHF